MSDHEEGYVIIEHHTGSFGTFVWGLLLGAATALLLAPKSGRETREELSESFYRLRDEAENRVREVQVTVNDAVDDMRRQFEHGVESARQAVESGRDAARTSRQQVERRVNESREAFRSGYEAARAASATSADEDGAESEDAGSGEA